MPRRIRDGSIFHEPAIKDPKTRRIITPERFIVRKRFTDRQGKLREKKRIAYTVTEAQDAKHDIELEIAEEMGRSSVELEKKRTVSDVIAYCKLHRFTPPEYSGDTKISGQRSWRATHNALKEFDKFLGPTLISEVRHDDFEKYKRHRLRTPIRTRRVRFEKVNGKRTRVEYFSERPRSIASVNRELSWARRVFSIALEKKWIKDQPFERKALIENSLENKKLRILSFDEERRLFKTFAKDPKRSHLPFAVVMALETTMRKSEQFRLNRYQDVDIEGRLITALSYKGKRAKRRFIPITDVLMPQLVTHLAETEGPRVFDFEDPKKGFVNCCRAAGINGVTWHTLRHTAITRMVHVYKIPPADVMKISGHTNWQTFMETYVNIDEDMARLIGDRINTARIELPLPANEIEQATDLVN